MIIFNLFFSAHLFQLNDNNNSMANYIELYVVNFVFTVWNQQKL